MTKVRWTASLRDRIRRKFKAGFTCQRALADLGCGERKLKEEWARLRRELGDGGGRLRVQRRREKTVHVALLGEAKTAKRRRSRPLRVVEVNAAVRCTRQYASTPIRTTSHDLAVSGGRRVLRSTGIGMRRQRALLEASEELTQRSAAEEAARCVPRAGASRCRERT